MKINNERDQIRQIFFDAWHKYNNKEPMYQLEQQLITIIHAHPEYQAVLNNSEDQLKKDYTTGTNPFLHMGLHLSLLAQLNTNRPKGIQDYYQKLVNKVGGHIKSNI